MTGDPPSPPPTSRLRTALRALGSAVPRYVVEALIAVAACILAFHVYDPSAWGQLRSHVLLRIPDFYRPGDSGGTLFLLVREVLGEPGDKSLLLSWPDGFFMGADFPNLFLTDVLAWGWRMWGAPLGINVGLVAVLVTNGLAVYLAARQARAQVVPALVGGAIAVVLPPLLEETWAGRPVTAAWAPAILATPLFVEGLRSWGRSWLFLPGAACLSLGVTLYPYGPALLAPWTLAAGLLALVPFHRGKLARALVGLAVAVGALAWTLHRNPSFASPATLGSMPSLCQESLTLGDLFELARPATSLWLPGTLWIAGALGALLAWRRIGAWGPPFLAAVFLLAVSLGTDPGSRWEEGTRCGLDRPWMPYVQVMKHLSWYRGCPRPTRWGLAGSLLLCVWLAAVLSPAWKRRPALGRWLGCGVALLAAAGTFHLLVHQGAHPRYLSWPLALPALPADAVVMDLPLRFRDDQVPYLLAASQPLRRMNPPGGGSYPRWLERKWGMKRLLLNALLPTNCDASLTEAQWAALRGVVPEVRDGGLTHVVVHLRATGQPACASWWPILEAAGGRMVSRNDHFAVFEMTDRAP